MSLKLPDKGQWALYRFCYVSCYVLCRFCCCLLFEWKNATVIWKNFDSMLLWRIMTESNIRSDIRITAIPSLFQVWFHLSLCLFLLSGN
jgi:type IV secretion system protein VirD4